jgi:hypothetical protein
MVSMTEVESTRMPEGWWVATVNVGSMLKPHPLDERLTHDLRPLTEPSSYWAMVYGEGDLEVQRTPHLHTAPGHYASMRHKCEITSPEPFVVVRRRDGEDAARRGFTAAREVYVGELGRSPQVYEPVNVRRYLKDPDDIRRDLHWVPFWEVAETTGLSPADIIRGFAGFSKSTIYEPNVPLLSHNSIMRVYTGEVPRDFCAGESWWGGDNAMTLDRVADDINYAGQRNLWIHQSFALKVLRLVEFGYNPGAESLGAIRLDAPLPEAPPAQLPVLTTEQFQDLEPQLMELLGEVSEAEFQQTAERVLGLGDDDWKADDVMNDSGSFQYRNRFQSLRALGGRLVISRCFWTRAGEPESDHYYSGLVSVFPEAVTDARRDQSAILRIWFTSDRAVRETPTGLQHGLIPPGVPADAAALVERFLASLGYNE